MCCREGNINWYYIHQGKYQEVGNNKRDVLRKEFVTYVHEQEVDDDPIDNIMLKIQIDLLRFISVINIKFLLFTTVGKYCSSAVALGCYVEAAPNCLHSWTVNF